MSQKISMINIHAIQKAGYRIYSIAPLLVTLPSITFDLTVVVRCA
jgi:hypothetical protein